MSHMIKKVSSIIRKSDEDVVHSEPKQLPGVGKNRGWEGWWKEIEIQKKGPGDIKKALGICWDLYTSLSSSKSDF